MVLLETTLNNIFKNNNLPIIRFLSSNNANILKTSPNTYLIIIFDDITQTFYKIPVGSYFNSTYIYKIQSIHICIDTLYTAVKLPFNLPKIQPFNDLNNKLKQYKPIYFDRFKYVGKGFKLIFKKKKHMFNCIFGHSHIF